MVEGQHGGLTPNENSILRLAYGGPIAAIQQEEPFQNYPEAPRSISFLVPQQEPIWTTDSWRAIHYYWTEDVKGLGGGRGGERLYYDEQGRVIKVSGGEQASYVGTQAWDIEYEYDDYGNKTLERYTDTERERPTETTSWTYEYDNNGAVKSIVEKNGEGNPLQTTTYQRDEAGRPIRVFVEKTNGKLSSVEEFEYNLSGQLIRRGSRLGGLIWEYEYDSEGNLVRKTERVARGGVRVIQEFEYNGHGNQTRVIVKDGNDNVYNDATFEYDDHGNVVKGTTRNAQGEIESTRTYEFTYELVDKSAH